MGQGGFEKMKKGEERMNGKERLLVRRKDKGIFGDGRGHGGLPWMVEGRWSEVKGEGRKVNGLSWRKELLLEPCCAKKSSKTRFLVMVGAIRLGSPWICGAYRSKVLANAHFIIVGSVPRDSWWLERL